ncbi:MAG: hypothetical protein MR016_12400 [Agathobacter sp.]|nr:hypothetical protein [Agathobacter sp.]
MKKAKIVSALIGLAGAVSNNGTTENTDAVIEKALLSEEDEQELVELIHTEKFQISPNCATCENPCGNTSDYEVEKFEECDADIQTEKDKLFDTIVSYLTRRDKSDAIPELIYRAIAYLGYDLEVKSYEKMIGQIKEL